MSRIQLLHTKKKRTCQTRKQHIFTREDIGSIMRREKKKPNSTRQSPFFKLRQNKEKQAKAAFKASLTDCKKELRNRRVHFSSMPITALGGHKQ